MAKNSQRLLLSPTTFLTLLLINLSLAIAIPDDDVFYADNVFDFFYNYGLPMGLLPNAVKNFNQSPNGEFEVELERSCYVQFKELFYYEKKITGRLFYGVATNVTGIHAKKFFDWVPVIGIETNRNSDLIEFYTGFLSEQFPVEQFQNVPICQKTAYAMYSQGTNPESLFSEE